MKKILYISLLSILILSCNKSDQADIDSNILIELSEFNGKQYINAETERDYNCLFPIIYTDKVKGSSIKIDFRSINEDGPCLTAIGPASALIELKNLTKDKYEIKFKLNGKVTKGRLHTNPFEITLDDNGNVKLK